MLLIKSKWVFGKQMLGEKVDDGWEEHLKHSNIKYEKINDSETKRKTVQGKDKDFQTIQSKGD